MTASTYETLYSQTVYQGKIFAVRMDEVTMPGGGSARRDVVTKDGAVAIVALNDKGQVALIHQYRHPLGEKLWELPAGLVDDPQKGPWATAASELREETGFDAATWERLAKIAASPGFTDETTIIFFATDLHEVGRPEAHDEEADLELRWVDLGEAVRWVYNGTIINAHTVAGILAAAVTALNGQLKSQEVKP